jgi:DNA-binding IclR family transcriptional regulator
VINSAVPLSDTHETTYLGRLLDAIELVSGKVPAASYREAARVLSVPPSTAHRLLTLLLERGYCDRTDDGAFRAGPRLLSIGVQALEQLPNWAAASAIVEELGRATDESASVGILIGDEIVLIARHNSSNPLTAVATVGDVLPAHTTAMGKAILASVPAATRQRLVSKFAPTSVAKILSSLDTELADIARRQFSVDEETFTPGMRCRAVPIFDDSSMLLGGISVSGPSVRFTVAKADRTVPLLKDAARRLIRRPRSSRNSSDWPDVSPAIGPAMIAAGSR